MRTNRRLLRGAALIRPGRDEDAPGFIALIERCWSDYPGCVLDVDREAPELRALASYYTRRGGALWVAEDGAGMIATVPLEAGAWEVARVYVHPDRHGAGLAEALLATAERHAISAGARELVLWTDTRFRRAHAFYEKHSYVRVGPVRALHDIAATVEYRYAKPVDAVWVLDVAGARSAERRLSDILTRAVDGGASVSFLRPLDPAKAQAFWREVTASVGTGRTMLLAAWCGGVLAGTVQLIVPASELGRHRAELGKFLVDPRYRRRGLGGHLLRAAESAARAMQRTLLLLDTRAGDDAERLYRAHGWTEVGRIDGYTLDAEGRRDATVLFAKRL